MKVKDVKITKKIVTLFLMIAIITIVSGTILHFNATLNPEQSESGSVDVGYALKFAKEYNAGVDGYGYSYGRWATTMRAIKYLKESGIGQLFIGCGPGFTTASVFDSGNSKGAFQRQFDKLKIGYGTTAMIRIAIEYGMLGVCLYSVMLILMANMCRKLYQCEQDLYWKAFACGSVGFSFSMIFFAFAYHSTTFWGDTMPALYFYVMAVVSIRYRRCCKVNTPITSITQLSVRR